MCFCTNHFLKINLLLKTKRKRKRECSTCVSFCKYMNDRMLRDKCEGANVEIPVYTRVKFIINVSTTVSVVKSKKQANLEQLYVHEIHHLTMYSIFQHPGQYYFGALRPPKSSKFCF